MSGQPTTPQRRKRTVEQAAFATSAALIIALAAGAPDYVLVITGSAILSGLFAASADLLTGVAGILSLGSALFFGIGAYGVGLSFRYGLPFGVGMIAGVGVACLVAGLTAAAALNARRTSVQFALLMLITSLGAEQVITSGYGWSGGSNGIAGIIPPGSIGIGGYFGLLGLVAMAVLLLLRRVANGRFGWLLRLQGDDPRLAEALGYDVKRVKIACTLITAATSAIAGALYAPLNGIANPAMFGVLPNMLVLIWIAIGGSGTLLGPFAAGFLLTLLQFELGSQLVDWYMMVMGLVFVAAVIWAPGGVWRFSRRAELRS